MKNKILFLLILILPFILNVQNVIIDIVKVKENNAGILDISILIEGSSKGTNTNFDSNKRIEISPIDFLAYSFLGVNSREVTITIEKIINTALLISKNILDKVAVSIFDIKKKSDPTDSIAFVDVKNKIRVELAVHLHV